MSIHYKKFRSIIRMIGEILTLLLTFVFDLTASNFTFDKIIKIIT